MATPPLVVVLVLDRASFDYDYEDDDEDKDEARKLKTRSGNLGGESILLQSVRVQLWVPASPTRRGGEFASERGAVRDEESGRYRGRTLSLRANRLDASL